MFKKLKQKININGKLQKCIVFLLFVFIFEFLVPIHAKAEVGETLYGKWYTADEIVFSTQIEVAGSDGTFRKQNFGRVGDKGTVQVRIIYTLVKPSTLTFNTTDLIGQSTRDGVKAGTRTFGFGSRIFGLVGVGESWGVKDRVVCDWKAVNISIIQDKTEIQSCKDSKTGKSSDNASMKVTYNAGDAIYANTFSVSQSDLKDMAFSQVGKAYPLQVWPNLVVNSGDAGLTEAVLATGITVGASKLAPKLPSIISGASSKAASLLTSLFNNKTKAAVELEKDFVSKGLSVSEAQKIARVVVEGVSELQVTKGAKLEASVLENISGSIIKKLMAQGMVLEDAMLIAVETLGSAVITSTKTVVGSVAAQEAALKAGILIAEQSAIKVGVGKVAAKTAMSIIAKVGLKFAPLIGWAWSAVDLGLYLWTFSKEELPMYAAAQDVYIQVYADENTAIAESNDPPPAEIKDKITDGASQGSANNVKNTGSTLLGFVNELIGIVIGVLQEFVYLVFYWLLAPLIQAMLSIHVYTDAFAAVIYPGWEVIRNICNIFFIVALIVIAMATLFRVESYQFRSLLVQLILAALLINFSLVIGQAILGLADTIQSQFLPNNVEVIRSLAKDLMVSYRSIVYTTNFMQNDSFSGIVRPLFLLALSIGSFGVFAAIAIFLTVRIVALWVLLMISPIAYAVGILPATAKYRGEWWSMFLKYAFFTPIMAFFLNLTAVISNTYKTNPVLQAVNSDNLQASLGGSSVASFVVTIASNILLLVFLMAALKVAEEAGIMGASAVSDIAKKGMFAPFAVAGGGLKMLGGYAARKYSDWTVNEVRGHNPKAGWAKSIKFALVNPVAIVKGFQKRSEELSHASQGNSESAGLEVVEQRLTHGKKIIPRVLTHEKSEEDKFAKDFAHLNREGVVKAAMDILQMKDDNEGKAMKRAIIKLALDKGYIDDIVQDGAKMETPEGQAYIKKLTAAGIVDQKAKNWKKDWDEVVEKDEDGNMVKRKKLKHDDRQRRAMYKAFFGDPNKHMHIHDQAALRMITEEGEESGKKTGHFEHLKDGKKDIKTGTYMLREDEFYNYNDLGELQYLENGDPEVLKTTKEQIAAFADSDAGRSFAAAEVAKLGDRAQAAAAYHSFLSLAKQGKIVDQRFISAIARAMSTSPGFMAQRTSPNVIFGSGTLTEKQKEHLASNGRVLIDRETFRAMKQISNAEGGGEVLASMYSMGVFNKKDDAQIKAMLKNGGITFDIGNPETGSVTSNAEKLSWKISKQTQEEMDKEIKKSKETETSQKKTQNEEEAYRNKTLELLERLANK